MKTRTLGPRKTVSSPENVESIRKTVLRSTNGITVTFNSDGYINTINQTF